MGDARAPARGQDADLDEAVARLVGELDRGAPVRPARPVADIGSLIARWERGAPARSSTLTWTQRAELQRAARPPVRRRTIVLVVAAALLSLGIGLTAVLVVYPTCPTATTFAKTSPTGCFKLNGDAYYFNTQARLLRDGNGFASPQAWNLRTKDTPPDEAIVPGAGHPPVYTVFLATLDRVGITSVNGHRIVETVVVAFGVLLIGLAAFRVGGARGNQVAPIAALLAAVYPMIWINSYRYLSESIYVPIIALVLLTAYGFWRRPTWRSAASFGAMIGLASLVRGEGIFLLGFTLPVVLWALRSLGVKRMIRLGAIVTVVTLAVMAPWVVFNLVRFHEDPVTITSGTGSVLLYGSCDEAFSGPNMGYYSPKCGESQPSAKDDPAMLREDHVNKLAREQATSYLRAHTSELPLVYLARVERMWDVYAPFQNVDFNDTFEKRGRAASLAGLWFYWALLPVAGFGGYTMQRRGIVLSPFVGFAAAVTITAMLSFGITRYRLPADVALVILAAVGLDALLGRFSAWMSTARRMAVREPQHNPPTRSSPPPPVRVPEPSSAHR
jgi:hypothetical protein